MTQLPTAERTARPPSFPALRERSRRRMSSASGRVTSPSAPWRGRPGLRLSELGPSESAFFACLLPPVGASPSTLGERLGFVRGSAAQGAKSP